MKKIRIAEGIEISPIGLGTSHFGVRVSEAEAFWQMDRYVESGNLIDTAHVYSDWVPGERSRSERIIGRWLKSRGGRDRVIISTKGGHPSPGSMHVPRLSPAEITGDLEDSLRCLGVDSVDLYFLHRDDVTRPVGEMLECLEAHRRAGRIRAYGCSNWTLPRLLEARAYAEAHGLPGFVCNQLMWSLAVVDPKGIGDPTMVCMDGPTYRLHRDTGMAAIAYTSVANGYFAHRQRGDLSDAAHGPYAVPANDALYARLLELSGAYGLSLTALSLAYFSAVPFPAAALASFRREEQLGECLSLLEADIDPELLRTLSHLRGDLEA